MNTATAYFESLAVRAGFVTFTALMFLPTGFSAQADDAVGSDTLTGQWDARVKLEENGVAPFAVLTTEAWGNVAGGVETRAWFNQLLDFGFSLDTAKLGWWHGGTFYAQAHWVEHAGKHDHFDQFTGAFNPVSSSMAGDQLRVFNLYYQHDWNDGEVVLKIGQIAADDDFMGSDYAGLFLNSAFGAMPSQVGTPLGSCCGNPTAFPIFPVAAPGGFLSARLSESFQTQLGLYYGRPGFDERSNHGFGWAEQSAFEVGLFWETTCHYKLAGRPATLKVGLSHHTGPLDDFRGTTTGEERVTQQAVPNYYAIHDLQLLSDSEGKPKLGVFCRGGITPEPDKSMVSAYADAGLNWFAPLPGRANDVAGAAVSWTRFGRAFRNSTGPEGVAESEITVELTYRAPVTRWLAMQADAQFLFNPAANPNSSDRETATVLGLRAEISF